MMNNIKEMVRKAKWSSKYEFEMRQKMNTIMENNNRNKCKKNKLRNGKNLDNNKPITKTSQSSYGTKIETKIRTWVTSGQWSVDKTDEKKRISENNQKSKVSIIECHCSDSDDPYLKFKADPWSLMVKQMTTASATSKMKCLLCSSNQEMKLVQPVTVTQIQK